MIPFLYTLQENKKSTNSYFHNDNLIALVDNLFIAGMDTTSNTLCWAILLMMKYPEVQSKQFSFDWISIKIYNYLTNNKQVGEQEQEARISCPTYLYLKELM